MSMHLRTSLRQHGHWCANGDWSMKALHPGWPSGIVLSSPSSNCDAQAAMPPANVAVEIAMSTQRALNVDGASVFLNHAVERRSFFSPSSTLPGQQQENSQFFPGAHFETASRSRHTTAAAKNVITRMKSQITMNMLKSPKACTMGNFEVPEIIRLTAVVAVVVSIAPAARVYVQEKRVSKVPEIGGGMTALSAQVSAKTKISSAPRVYGGRRCGVRGVGGGEVVAGGRKGRGLESPTQRIRKMPKSSSSVTWSWPMHIQQNMARKIDMMI